MKSFLLFFAAISLFASCRKTPNSSNCTKCTKMDYDSSNAGLTFVPGTKMDTTFCDIKGARSHRDVYTAPGGWAYMVSIYTCQ